MHGQKKLGVTHVLLRVHSKLCVGVRARELRPTLAGQTAARSCAPACAVCLKALSNPTHTPCFSSMLTDADHVLCVYWLCKLQLHTAHGQGMCDLGMKRMCLKYCSPILFLRVSLCQAGR